MKEQMPILKPLKRQRGWDEKCNNNHLFIQQIYELLLCARHWGRGWGYSGEQDRSSLLSMLTASGGDREGTGITVVSDHGQLWGPDEGAGQASRKKSRLGCSPESEQEDPARAQEGNRERGMELEEMGSQSTKVTQVLRIPGRSRGGVGWKTCPGITISPALQTETQRPKSEQGQIHPFPTPLQCSSHCSMVFQESQVLPQNLLDSWEWATFLARPHLPTPADQSRIK